ncbi:MULTISPECIES: hypothetical protein [Tenacibaculum]|uniref:hypothetical protein n=1 Tax=Tenacibaculum TaxID=104267 RepID=UPI001F0B2B51|nr:MULTISPECIES: hypothetical protein [Tenacibaculum]MCH3882883.1 hypothetical protein [Tenacibaculum aquimarinum]MDO6600408.1 hypothetical protein [Tenacibaculum sp. 1_MG-2023]
MNKLWKIIQYGYLVVAVICLVEGIIRFNSDRNKAYLFLIVAVLVTFMFFVKRRLRQKIEKRNSNKPN